MQKPDSGSMTHSLTHGLLMGGVVNWAMVREQEPKGVETTDLLLLA
jgi:hypothetical protein